MIRRKSRILRVIALAALGAMPFATPCAAQNDSAEASNHPAEHSAARNKAGKKLFGTEDVLRLHTISSTNVKVSPDGSRIAFTASEINIDTAEPGEEWKSKTELWIVPVSGPASAAKQYTHSSSSVSSPSWSPDGKQIAFLRGTPEKETERQAWLQWIDGGEAEKVTSHKGGFTAVSFSPDGKKLLLTAADQPSKNEADQKKVKDDAIVVDHDLKMSHLWLFDLATKKESRLTEGDFTVSDAEWSPDGAKVSFTANPTPRADDGDLATVWMVDVASKQRRKLVVNSDAPTHTARWSADGKWVAFLSVAQPFGVHKTDLFVVPADGSGAPRKLTESFDLDAGTPVWLRGHIFFSAETRENVEVFWTNATGGPVGQATHLPGTFQLAGATEPKGIETSVVVGVYSTPQRPGEIATVTDGSDKAVVLTDVNHRLTDFALGESEIVKWKSNDGTEIEGVLTKPVDFDPARKYPLLLNPHGGPTGASADGFNPTSQVMAANGYLVLQPNFRGSTGRGEAFAAANKNNWGKGDYEDCISGVNAIVQRGIADPNRLGAFGWSYGGYMTFWILTQTNMFKAISPGAGLTDLAAMYSQNDIQRYLRWFFGDKSPWDNEQQYWDHSPMKYVNNVKTPALILQGQADPRVPMAQAQEMYHALSERGIPVEFVLYPREPHGFTEPRHIQDRMRRYLTFFGKYLNNPPVTDTPLKSAPSISAADSQ
ncbi:MAG TPA: S9 family peptidase [Candidatus Acidoferrales bacterium]|nr:S9 family peptidase [Candidatus Acidoferrales bacterium]